MVIVILVTVAGLVTVRLSDPAEDPRFVGTETTMNAIRDAIVGRSAAGSPAVTGYLADMKAYPKQLPDLLRQPPGASPYDEQTQTGWRGPYLRAPTAVYQPNELFGFTEAYAQFGEPMVDDLFDHDEGSPAWKSPIVLQYPDLDGDGLPEEDHEDPLYVRLVSAGPNGILDTPQSHPTIDVHYPPLSACGDDIVVYLRVADLRPDV